MNEKLHGHADRYRHYPIPKTHRRLAEAHLLWHQTLDKYQEPDAFRANLNSCIEALRNVTFVLQKEKRAFTSFDGWYSPWQARLKDDKAAKWAHDARTTVVHQGELQSHSVAEVRLVTWRDEIIARMNVPVCAASEEILHNPKVVDLIAKSRTLKADLKDAAIAIERKWTTAELGESELLDTLAQVYGVLSDLVLDAHTHLNQFGCIPAVDDHPDLRSANNRTGTLPCMAAGPERRTEVFKLDTGEQFLPQSAEFQLRFHPGENPGKRYGIERGSIADWEMLDPLRFAKRILDQAKRIIRQDKYHQRMMFIRNGQGRWEIHKLIATDRTEKHLVMRMIAQKIESESCDALIEVGESWTASAEVVRDPNFVSIEKVKGRGEALTVIVATREGIRRAYLTPFRRGPLGGIKLGDTTETEAETYFYYLQPIFQIWRKHGTVKRSDGETLRRLWEPAGLEPCYCGDSKRFAECCQKNVPPWSASPISRAAITEAMARSEFGRAEELSRALLAQYVIWVKRHTEPTMNVAQELHEKLVTIDADALEDLVFGLGRAMEANGNTENLVPHVRRLAQIVGVPHLNMRLTAISALWMFRNGKTEEAVLELDGLGDLDKLRDPRILVMAAEIMDFPPENRENTLLRALTLAVDEEEKWTVQFALAQHFIAQDESTRALPYLDSIIADSAGRVPQIAPYPEARMRRWQISKTPGDLQLLLETIAQSPRSERVQYVATMIDAGEFAAAEQSLAPDIAAGDPMAKSLVVDARIRQGHASAARDLLLSIDSGQVSTYAKKAYAVASGLVALSCHDEKIRRLAISLLEKLSCETTAGNDETNMLNALRSESFADVNP
jgi:hypothetical protein